MIKQFKDIGLRWFRNNSAITLN